MTKQGHLLVSALVIVDIAVLSGIRHLQHLPPHAVLEGALFLAGGVAPDFDTLFVGRRKPDRKTLLNSHRGITHHLGLAAVMLLAGLLFSKALLWFALGWSLHLFLDMFSLTGISYYRYQDRVRFSFYITRDLSEALFVLLLSVLLAVVPILAFAQDVQPGVNITKIWNRYMELENRYDNKTNIKRDFHLSERKINKAMKNKQAKEMAEKSYEYYKKHVQPQVRKDMEAFLNGRNVPYAFAFTKPSGQVLGRDEYVYLFMSSSVPKTVWKNYVFAISKLRKEGQGNIGIILRGCIGGCQKVMPTIRFIMSVFGGKKPTVPILIDPLLFRLYDIKRVPAFVYAKGVSLYDVTASPGWGLNLKSKKITAYKVVGDCGFSYALKELYAESGDGKMLTLFNLLNRSWFEEGKK